jgi:hypothetical protein
MTSAEREVGLAQRLAKQLLPDALEGNAHIEASFERAVEATSKALVRLELVQHADEEQLREVAAEAFAAMARARTALLDHAQSVLALARAWSGE